MQVQYVLSDKTGTLTQNIMGFVWASIGGKLHGKSVSEDAKQCGVPAGTPHTIALDTGILKALGTQSGKQADPDVAGFLMNLAVCNTVVPSVNEDGSLLYQVCKGPPDVLIHTNALVAERWATTPCCLSLYVAHQALVFSQQN